MALFWFASLKYKTIDDTVAGSTRWYIYDIQPLRTSYRIVYVLTNRDSRRLERVLSHIIIMLTFRNDARIHHHTHHHHRTRGHKISRAQHAAHNLCRASFSFLISRLSRDSFRFRSDARFDGRCLLFTPITFKDFYILII